MDFLNIFKNNNGGLLKKPGDKFSAEITKSGRNVLKLSTDHGAKKYSETHYQNGRVVKTLSEMRKKK